MKTVRLYPFVVYVVITSMAALSLSADTIVLDADSSAYVQRGSNSITNFGSSPSLLMVNAFNTSSGTQFLASWNLSSLPSEAVVTSATITFYKNYSINSDADGFTVEAYNVESSWTEEAVTWDSRPTINFGTKVASLSMDSSTFSDSAGTSYTITGSNLTNLVSSWASGSTTNFGLLFQATQMDNSAQFAYNSNDASNASYIPELTITYTIPESSSTAGILSLTALISCYWNRLRKRSVCNS